MGKVSELAMLVDELKKCGEMLVGISERLADLFSSTGEEKSAKKALSKKKAEPMSEEPEKKSFTLEEVRMVLAEKAFGTGDSVIVSDYLLSVVDFKYGVGVLVEAKRNPQLMCYALGALQLFDGIYDIHKIAMTIFQPRREHISTYEITKEELLEWADTILAPTAQLAAKGEGEFKAGEHCQFCKVKATCRKRAEYNLELARYDFEMPVTLEDVEIEVILSKVDELIAWGSDIKEYALQAAVNGREWNEIKCISEIHRDFDNIEIMTTFIIKFLDKCNCF